MLVPSTVRINPPFVDLEILHHDSCWKVLIPGNARSTFNRVAVVECLERIEGRAIILSIEFIIFGFGSRHDFSYLSICFCSMILHQGEKLWYFSLVESCHHLRANHLSVTEALYLSL